MRTERRWILVVVWLAVFVLASLSGFPGIQGVPAFGGPPDSGGGAGAIGASGEDDSSWELKLDANARLLLRLWGADQTDGLSRLQERLSINYVGEDEEWEDWGGYWEVGVFILVDNPEAAAWLAELDVAVSVQVGNIVAGWLPIESLPLVARQPFVQFVETSIRMKPSMDVSRPEIGADLVHQGLSLPAGYRGRGVIVGVVDSGIDFTHPDFSDPNGTRILYLLELLQSGSQIEWDSSDINSCPSAVTQRDTNGHGTHVTGTAAGSGRGNPIYRGIAPEADIVVVRGMRGMNTWFDADDVLQACQYIFDKAQALGKPAVINLSLGAIDPAGSWTLRDQSLSALTGPGRIIVASAGNDGYKKGLHAGGDVSANTVYGSLLLPADPSLAWVDVLYDAGTLERIQVLAYEENQGQLTWQAQTNWVGAGGQLPTSSLVSASGTALGDVDIDARTTSTPGSTCGRVSITVSDFSGLADIQKTCWAVLFETRAAGRVHMWASNLFGERFSSIVHNISGVTEWPGDANCTVGSPAIAEKVISVGAYATKVDWVNFAGDSYRSWEQAGELASFSSKGPTADGRGAPDICAPGSQIAAALSSHGSVLWSDEFFVTEWGRYRLMEGTSMAAPHVTGVVALMLQANRRLDYEKTVQILRTTARSDAFTGPNLPDNRSGWGKVDALAAVQEAAVPTPPEANDVPVTGKINSRVTVTLSADDDGLPGALSYVIASLPAKGRLEDMGGTPITQVPATLPAFADQVVYQPDADWSGQDSFTYYADDGGTTPLGGPSNTATVTITVVGEVTVEYQVSAGVDDVHLTPWGRQQNTKTPEIILGGHKDGFRFTNVQIPRGAIIKSASLSVCSWYGLEGRIDGEVRAEAADNPLDFSGGLTRLLHNLTLTTASQTWTIDAPWTSGTWYDSPNISQVVQEVIDRPGWNPGNALVVVNSTTSLTADKQRAIRAYDSDPTKAAKLKITYQPK
ncbi:MAG: S8 family serine peptidase [Sedimentisphaerales bacterium]|nr:S8 family serine peptidase [Sedimentisphaerales bacterium]